MTNDPGPATHAPQGDMPELSQAEYRLLLENSVDVVFLTVGGVLRWISPAFTALAGWRPEDLLGRSKIDFWHPDDCEAVAALRDRVELGETGTGVLRLRTRDGAYVWVELSLRPYRSKDGRPGVVGTLRDVGERVAAEQALAASEERYRLLADNVTDVLWVVDLDTGFYAYISPSVELLSGYTQAEVLGVPMEERLAPESAQLAKAMLGQALGAYLKGDADAVVVAEVGLLHKHGGVVPAEITARFLPSSDGRPHQVIGVSRDITERRAAEQALRMQRDLSVALSSISDLPQALDAVLRAALTVDGVDCGGVYLVDADTGDLDLAVHHGLPPAFVAGASHFAAGSPNAALVMAGSAVYRRHEEVESVVRPDRPGQEEGLRAAAVVPIRFEGRVVAALNLASHTKDELTQKARTVVETLAAQVGGVLARVRAEEALRESEERLNSVIEGTNVGTWDWHVQSGATVFNERWAEIVGWTLADLAPLSVQTWTDLTHPEDLKESEAQLAQVFTRGRSLYDTECRLRHRDGSWVWVHDRGKVTEWTADGLPKRMTGTHVDITARRAAEDALRARSDELDALLAVSRAIVSSLDYERVLLEVARSAGEALGSPECVVWEYAPHGDLALFRCLWEREPVAGLAQSLTGTSFDVATHTGGLEGLRSGNVMQQSRSDPWLSPEDCQGMDKWDEKTWLTVPLVSERGLLGVMTLVETERERTFTTDEVRLAAAIGEQAAVALDNALLHREQEERNRWLDALVEAGRQVASKLAMDELLENVARLAAESVRAPVAYLYEYAAERDMLIARSRYGPEGVARSEPIGTALSVDETPEDRRALIDGEVFVETLSDPGLADYARRVMEVSGEKTLVNVPFRFAGEPLGMLVLIETEAERVFTPDELAYLRAFGEQTAVALNNARLYAKIEAQAASDGLTGLANHRTFHERLEQELARAQRYGTPLSLLLLDVDDFKAVNDVHGHQAGDEVLRLLAGIIAGEVRCDIDVPARYGGEEFAVILPSTDIAECVSSEQVVAIGQRLCDEDETPAHEAGAEVVAERIRAHIAATSFPCGEAQASRVTVSIGVASYPRMAADARALLACADAALYAAKRAGKNVVSLGEGSG